MVTAVVLLIICLALLAGYYRGVIYSLVSLGITILSLALALICIPLVSNTVKGNEELYDMMLYYFEGYEYINNTAVELVHANVTEINEEELDEVITNADMPLPFGRAIKKNISNKAYAADGIETLGDYFNQTIVDVVINILSLLLLFVIFRISFGLILHIADYGVGGLPVLAKLDVPISLGIGFLHGIMLTFIVFMLVPIALTVLPALGRFIEGSAIGEFFYRLNPFIWLVRTT
ncbi:MAG TPA: hypothetical protein PLM48_03550 [Clostridia bacterium]|nr:hypothetical protein [Clostridia bacterium]